MATPKTLVSVEAVTAMIQKAENLLAEAQALGQQYVSHSHDIAGVGWGGDANMTSTMVSEHVNSDLVKMVTTTKDLLDQLNNFQNQALAQEADARHALQSVHPGGGTSST
jgi:uncharacterized protein YukE